MRTPTPIRTLAATAAIGLVIAACGQKPTVAHIDNGASAGGTGIAAPAGAGGAGLQQPTQGGTDQAVAGGATAGAAGGGAAAQPGGGGGQAAGGGQTGGAAGGGGDQAGGGGQPAGDTGAGGGGDAGGGGGGDAGGSAPAAQTSGSDSTGVTAESITVGVHAPATGAAPLPTTSFEKARDTYWRYVTESQGQKVLGRSKVEVAYRDDKYAPDSAIQVCRELASEAFLLVGGGGTDQIQACGQLAANSSFPYFSSGVTESGLAGNPWYFAASMTYRQQGGLLAQYVRKNPNGVDRLGANAKIGTIITATPNFADARDGWLQGLTDNGLKNIDTFEHPKGDTSWYASTAQRFQKQGIEVVYFLSSPVDYLNFANVADERFGYNPQYVGVGVSKAINAVLQSGCGAPDRRIDNGIFLHPYPGLDWAQKNAPDFFAASEEFGTPNDDIAFALWGLAAAQHKLFQAYEQTFGTDLFREDFRALVEGGLGTLESGIYPPVTYTPDNHFGASSAHVLQANCETNKHETLVTFASGF